MWGNDLKNYKALLVLALIFFTGFGIFAILQYSSVDDSFWDQSNFLTIVGATLGIILIICMLSSIYILLSIMKPHRTATNVVQIVEILMYLFILNSIMPDNSQLGLTLRIYLFFGLGLFIIIYNLVGYIISKLSNKEKSIVEIHNEKRAINPAIKNDKEPFTLFNIFFVTIIISTLISGSTSTLGGYPFYILINFYFIYKYLNAIDSTKMNICLYTATSIVLLGISIMIYISAKDFLNQNEIIKGFVFILPISYLLPSVLKNYYSVIWEIYP